MSHMRHIFIKDLRRLRWSILGWCALVMARMLISTAGADIALGGFGPQIGIGELSALLSLTDVLFLALLISRLVHDEPLVGRDASRRVGAGGRRGAHRHAGADLIDATEVGDGDQAVAGQLQREGRSSGATHAGIIGGGGPGNPH